MDFVNWERDAQALACDPGAVCPCCWALLPPPWAPALPPWPCLCLPAGPRFPPPCPVTRRLALRRHQSRGTRRTVNITTTCRMWTKWMGNVNPDHGWAGLITGVPKWLDYKSPGTVVKRTRRPSARRPMRMSEEWGQRCDQEWYWLLRGTNSGDTSYIGEGTCISQQSVIWKLTEAAGNWLIHSALEAVCWL